MDKLDICIIPLIYLFRMTLTFLSFAIVFVPTTLKIWSALNNGLTWIALISIHLILFILKRLHSLVTIKLMTWSSPRCPLRSRFLVCIKNHLFIVGIGPIINKELGFIYQSDCYDRTYVYS